jgi:predicted secreted protein
MRKMILAVLATSLIAASTVQMADAAERHVRHAHHDSFRGAYNQLSTPANADTGYNWRDDAKFEPAGS